MFVFLLMIKNIYILPTQTFLKVFSIVKGMRRWFSLSQRCSQKKSNRATSLSAKREMLLGHQEYILHGTSTSTMILIIESSGGIFFAAGLQVEA